MPFNITDYTKPPFVNGVMDLTEEETLTVKEKLGVIADEFEPDFYNPVLDTFYLTATYNQSFLDERINGSTCEMCMSYEPPVEESTEEGDNIEPPQEANEEELTQEELNGEEPTEEV